MPDLVTLGIDPGTARCGFGIVAGPRDARALHSGCITTRAGDPLGTRLATIRDALAELVERHPVTDIALERLGYARRLTTAAQVAYATGVVHLVAADRGLPVEEYAPKEIKLAVAGYGGAEKDAVQAMVVRLLRMSAPPTSDHAADALATAICHQHSIRARTLERALGVR